MWVDDFMDEDLRVGRESVDEAAKETPRSYDASIDCPVCITKPTGAVLTYIRMSDKKKVFYEIEGGVKLRLVLCDFKNHNTDNYLVDGIIGRISRKDMTYVRGELDGRVKGDLR